MGHVFNRFLKKNLEFTSEVWVFSFFSVSCSTLFTASWLLIFVAVEPNQTILLIYRSEPRFKSHAGGKIGNFDVFC